MIEPNMKQVPDFSAYLDKDFLLEENMTVAGSFAIAAGNTFRITKINGVKVHIKLSSTLDDALPSLRLVADNIIKDKLSEVMVLEEIIKIWEEDKDEFVVSESSPFNKDDNGKLSGHCINTGFDRVPQDHPDVYGMAESWEYGENGKRARRAFSDTIMTFDYEHKKGRTNIYSYQEGQNKWYSKTCYEFMLLGVLDDIKVEGELTLPRRKDHYKVLSGKSFLKTFEMGIKELNNHKFHAV